MIAPGLHLVDTSAIARVANDGVARELARLGKVGLLATCVTIDLEVLFSARSPVEYARISQRRREAFVDLPLNAAIGTRVKEVQARLAAASQHRAVGAFDLLTAAVAEHYGAVVLHYDADFDHVSRVTGQPTRWVVPRGTVS